MGWYGPSCANKDCCREPEEVLPVCDLCIDQLRTRYMLITFSDIRSDFPNNECTACETEFNQSYLCDALNEEPTTGPCAWTTPWLSMPQPCEGALIPKYDDYYVSIFFYENTFNFNAVTLWVDLQQGNRDTGITDSTPMIQMVYEIGPQGTLIDCLNYDITLNLNSDQGSGRCRFGEFGQPDALVRVQSVV